MENTISIIHNEPLNRLEIQLQTVPANDLIKYLVTLGFKREKGDITQRTLYSPFHPAYVQFAHDLKIALENNEEYSSLKIRPSYIANEKNIQELRYSYVIISAEENQPEHFVVFDHYKRIAKAIATQYAQDVYGAIETQIEIFPKQKQDKALKLFKKGKILGSINQNHQELTPLPIEAPTALEDTLAQKQPIEQSSISQSNDMPSASMISPNDENIGFSSDMLMNYGITELYAPETIKKDPTENPKIMEEDKTTPMEAKGNTIIPETEAYENEIKDINKQLEECQNDLKGCKKKSTTRKKRKKLTRYAKIQNHLIAIGNLIPPRLKENVKAQKETKRMLKNMHRKIVTHYRMVSLKQICGTQEQLEEKYQKIVTRLENRNKAK